MALLARYRVSLQGVDVTPAITGLTVEENKGELAARATTTIALHPGQDVGLVNLAATGAKVELFADGERVYPPMRVVRWRFADAGAQRQLVVTAYDMLVNLTKSSEDLFFPRGLGAVDRIERVATLFGIPLGARGIDNVPLKERWHRNQKAADVIMETLQTARMRSGKNGLDYYVQGSPVAGDGTVMDVLTPGTNTRSASFDPGNATGIDDSWDIEELVTVVTVYGSAYDPLSAVVSRLPDDLPPTQTILTDHERQHPGQFGRLQSILYARDVGQADQGDALLIAAQTAAERGEPRRVQTVRTLDLPWVHKGQAHRFAVGTINSDDVGDSGRRATGRFVCTSVSRDWSTGEMTLAVDTSGFLGRYVALDPEVIAPGGAPGVSRDPTAGEVNPP